MKIKTADLIGPALDWAVAKCEGWAIEFDDPRDPWLVVDGIADRPLRNYTPSNDWSQGGPLIERERIALGAYRDQWCAVFPGKDGSFYRLGPTPLIAAMRCYVASKVGDMLEIPETLL